jgi:riboflavin kinase/FMN adenylyltransferase
MTARDPQPHKGDFARRAVVAIGVFDGLHLGHARILEHALARARAIGGRCVVLSFDPHPDLVLAKHGFQFPAPLTPLPEKRARLLAMGVERLDVLPFTRELAALTPEDFVKRHLVRPYRPALLVAGEGFALGKGRAGTCERLREIGVRHGFDVESVPLLERDGAPVSSTRIRALLGQGQVAEAARLLGRAYEIEGTVVTGHGLGKVLGFPTANLRLHEEKLVPMDGIYAARARLEPRGPWLPAAMSIGVRPTFDGTVRQLEVHVLDWNGDLVGKSIVVELVDWLRPEKKFESPEALVAAMDRDVVETRRRLAAIPAERT